MMFLAALAVATTVHATYAEAMAGRLRVMVDGYERGDRTKDHPHQVFVALFEGDRELGRADVTKYLLNDDEVLEVRAKVNLFESKVGDVADVILWSRISGSGSISAASDLFFRIRGGKLTFLGALERTEAFARSGWSDVTQTQSEIYATNDSVVWRKESRTGKRENAEAPFKVTCRKTETVYHYDKLRLVVVKQRPARTGYTPLPRLGLMEILSCGRESAPGDDAGAPRNRP